MEYMKWYAFKCFGALGNNPTCHYLDSGGSSCGMLYEQNLEAVIA
jgi:hypothetical protein